MEQIIEKLKLLESKTDLNAWNLKEKLQLLQLYSLISKKEPLIFNLIYAYQGCDSWEDIFRDYDYRYLNDKAIGVEIAIKEMKEMIEETS